MPHFSKFSIYLEDNWWYIAVSVAYICRAKALSSSWQYDRKIQIPSAGNSTFHFRLRVATLVDVAEKKLDGHIMQMDSNLNFRMKFDQWNQQKSEYSWDKFAVNSTARGI